MPIALEDGFALLDRGTTKLMDILEGRDPTSFSEDMYMNIYTTVYNMCTQKVPNEYSKELYDKYGELIRNHLRDSVVPGLKEKHDVFLLKELDQRWKNHKLMIRWLSRFFNYIDRYFVIRKTLPCLTDVGLACFREFVYDEMKGTTRDTVISLIQQEREGDQIDRAMVKNVLDIYIAIGLKSMDHYIYDFENAMLEATSEYYSGKATVWIAEDSCPEYMIKAEECLKREKERVSNYLHQSTEKKLLEKVQEQLLVVHQTELLAKEHSGCRVLLRDGKVEDLSRMYRLFIKIPQALDPVAAMFKEHVTAEGNHLLSLSEQAASAKKAEKKEAAVASTGGSDEQVYIRSLIQLHDKYMGYVVTCFQNNSLFHRSLRGAFESFCNKTVDSYSVSELMATYCDNVLKKGGAGSEKLDEGEIEETLEKVVGLLDYVNDKDVFAEFCRKKLARRLLFNISGSEDHEKSLLAKLKQQWGAQFTSKMEGMLTDFTLAKEQQAKFDEYRSNNPKDTLGTDISVTVLTTGFWPTYKSCDLILPDAMARCVEEFKKFYAATSKNRKITWIFSLGSCNVIGRFDARPIEMVVTTYHAAVLLLFNSSQRLSYADIQTQLKLMDEDLLRVLHSLSCAKYKVLNKEPNTRTISRTDVFEYNPKFTDKMWRIRINLPPTDEKKKVVEDVGKDRRYAVDASIVRIMKSRKVLAHQQLVTECIDQLSKMFRPEPKLIKKRIEELINRDYLERDTENPNVYKYLA